MFLRSLSFVAAVAAASSASAQQTSASPPQLTIVEQESLPVYVIEEPPARRTGFYFRAALGGGGLVDDFSGPFGWGASSAFGPSAAGELMFGGAIVPGLNVGGGVAVDWVVRPRIESNGVEVDEDVLVGLLGVIGPFVDWYPSANGGFHLQALLGAARITITDESHVRSDHEPLGAALLLGVGYDWWLGDEWALGVMARLTSAALVDQDVRHIVGALSIMGTLTFN
jgi:hypothetical protein